MCFFCFLTLVSHVGGSFHSWFWTFGFCFTRVRVLFSLFLLLSETHKELSPMLKAIKCSFLLCFLFVLQTCHSLHSNCWIQGMPMYQPFTHSWPNRAVGPGCPPPFLESLPGLGSCPLNALLSPPEGTLWSLVHY